MVLEILDFKDLKEYKGEYNKNGFVLINNYF